MASFRPTQLPGEREPTIVKNCPEKLHSKDTDTRAVHIVGCEAQWTQLRPRVQSQVDVIHLLCSTGTIKSNPHLHTSKAGLRKANQSRMGIICTV